MATSTSGGTTTSFTNTPQAKDDIYSWTESQLQSSGLLSGNVITLNVMANDLGGNAKTLWSIDDGIGNTIPGTPSTSGTLTVSDLDSGEAKFQTVAPSALQGTYGNFNFDSNTGQWSYALDNSKLATQALNVSSTVHDTLTVTSFDGT